MEGLNRDLWDLWIFGIGDASCVGILLYNVRYVQVCCYRTYTERVGVGNPSHKSLQINQRR